MEMAALSNSAGDFVFSLNENTLLTSSTEISGIGCSQTQLLNGKPRLDFVGGELDRKQFTGECYGLQDGSNLDDLQKLKDSRKPVVYVRNQKNMGLWVIRQININRTELLPGGKNLKTIFNVQLEEFPNE